MVQISARRLENSASTAEFSKRLANFFLALKVVAVWHEAKKTMRGVFLLLYVDFFPFHR